MSAVLISPAGLPPRPAEPPTNPAPPRPAPASGGGRAGRWGPAGRTAGQPEGRRGTGLVVVAGAHVLILWALVSGLAQKVVDVVKKPVDIQLVSEAPPPPPPPPPKLEKIREVKTAAPPPPVYVPPVEVAVATAPPVIAVTQSEPPKESAPAAAPAPEPAAPPPPAVARQEISLACPGYQNVLAGMLEDAFDRVGVVGTVRTRLTVRGNQVVAAEPLSGPKEYFKYVQGAAKRMKCSAGGSEEVQVALEVNFRK